MYKTLLSAAVVGLTGVSGVYADISTVVSRVSQAAYPCGHTISYAVETDPSDAARSAALIALSDAAASWDRAAGRVLFAYSPSGGADLIVTIAASSSDPLWYEAGGTYATYESSLSGQNIAISHVQDKTRFQHLLAHEFGHALGLADSTSTDSLMSLDSTSTTPSDEDIRALRMLCGGNSAVIQ